MTRAVIVGVIVVGIGVTLLLFKTFVEDTSSPLADSSEGRCLQGTEEAVYEVIEAGRPGRVRVSVVDTISSTTVWSKEFTLPSTTHVQPYELRRCHFYLHQSVNYDFENNVTLEGYVWDLQKFSYFSEEDGEQIVVFSENSTGKSRVNSYGTTFSVDPSEQYISLEQSSLGKDDYALVIKNINTGENVLVLSLADIIAKYPNAAGSFDTGRWYETPDGVYLDSDTYDGSRIGAQIFIRRDTWDVEILPTPDDYLPGVERSSHPLSPYWAYTDVIVWTGLQEMNDILLEDQIAGGQQKNLIVVNLRTSERTIVATVPIVKDHRFNFKWLSATELQYTMPDGVIKTYRMR